MYNKKINKISSIVFSTLILISCLIFYTTMVKASVTNGWKQIGPTIYLFNNGVKATGWSKSGNSLYYFTSKSGMIIGWINYNNQWYYTDSNGKMVKGLVTIRGSQYYFNSCGVKQNSKINTSVTTGWKQIGSTIYLLNNGVKVTGWSKKENSLYYFTSKSGMTIGWINYNNQWYYTDANGEMAKGSVTIKGSQYYFNSCGVKQTGWVNFGYGDWHYLRSDGTVAKDITPNHVLVGKVGCAYSSIQQAINSVPNCAISLIIQPGTYYEHVTSIAKNISLLGINKTTCIIRDDSGNYFNAPLTISGNGNISNLTFISTHDKSNYQIPSYAVHCDSAGAGTLTFTNCNFISYQSSAVGIGLHQNQMIIFNSCQFIKNSTETSHNSGAFYCHNAVASNTTNQHLIIKNSQITTNAGIVMRIDDANSFAGGINSQMDICLYNNILTSAEKGKSNIINVYNDPINGGICGQIKLVKGSTMNGISFAKFLK